MPTGKPCIDLTHTEKYANGKRKACHTAGRTRRNAENPEREKAHAAKTRAAHPERVKANNAKRTKFPEKMLLGNAKTRARKRGLPPPTITESWVVEQLRTVTHCPLSMCGHVRMERSSNGNPRTNSPTLDQRDVCITYTPENTALICYGCNRRKNDLSPSQLRELADYAGANSWLALPVEQRQLNIGA